MLHVLVSHHCLLEVFANVMAFLNSIMVVPSLRLVPAEVRVSKVELLIHRVFSFAPTYTVYYIL